MSESMNQGSVPPPAPQTGGSSDEKTWAALCHASALSGFLIPFGNIIGPLVIWLVKKSTMPLVDDQGKESLNFQISVLIYAAISAVLIFVVIGFVLLIAVGIFALVMTIIAAVKASGGDRYRYPLCIRFIK
jgi:hypothetical protein